MNGVAAVALVAAFSAPAFAGPGRINGPEVEKGEVELESTSIYGFDYDESDYEFEQEFEIEYGLTDQILLETEIEFEKENDEDTVTEALALGLRYELTAEDSFGIGSAIALGYDFSGTGGADSVGATLLLGKHFAGIESVANIGVEHEVGDDNEDGYSLDVNIGLYKETESEWTYGIEYFGDIGNLEEQDGYSSQSHSVGPYIGHEVHVGEHAEFEYAIGYYQGISRGAEDGTVKLELGLEF